MNTLTAYLKDDAPAEIVDRLKKMEMAESKKVRNQCLEAAQKKNATWLIQFDGFTEAPFVERESPDYFMAAEYELLNAPWDVRLYIAPDTKQAEAETLAKGIAEWIGKMDPQEYERISQPPGQARIEPPKDPSARPQFDEVPF